MRSLNQRLAVALILLPFLGGCAGDQPNSEKGPSCEPAAGDTSRSIAATASEPTASERRDENRSAKPGGTVAARKRPTVATERPVKTPIGASAARTDTIWTMDLAKLKIPASPAAGRIAGREFKPDKIQLRNGILTLRQGKDFFPDLAVSVFLFLDEGKSLEGQSYDVSASKEFGNPHIHMKWRKEDKRVPETEIIMDQYVMRLEFGKATGRKLPGKIALCLPDDEKSFVAGTFTTELPVDHSKPPLAEDAPWVYGRIALKGAQEFKLRVGYLGYDAVGKRETNMVGTTIKPDRGGGAWGPSDEPRMSWLHAGKDSGCSYRHVKMAPGTYLVYVRWNDRFVDWRWVEVPRDGQLTIDFAIDPKNAGTIEVRVPERLANEKVRLLPLDRDGRLQELNGPVERLRIPYWLGTETTPRDGKAVFPDLNAGSYRVVAGELSADVTVNPGETATVDLAKGEMK